MTIEYHMNHILSCGKSTRSKARDCISDAVFPFWLWLRQAQDLSCELLAAEVRELPLVLDGPKTITESDQHQHFMATTVCSHACKIRHALQLPLELECRRQSKPPNSGRHSPIFLRDCPVFGNVNRIYTLNLAWQLHFSKHLQQSDGKTDSGD